MNKVNSMQFCLEDMKVNFDLNNDDVNEYRCNPIMNDYLYVEVFFPEFEKSVAIDIFFKNIELFFKAAFYANKHCKNLLDCDYSIQEIAEIKEAAEYAVSNLFADMSKVIPAVIISKDEVGFTDVSKVAVLKSDDDNAVETWYATTINAVKAIQKIEPVALVNHGYLLVVSKQEFDSFNYSEINTRREGELGEFKGKWTPIWQ
jgi:hypothetical protein